MRLWPRTLGMQLIALTVAAVFASNVGVAIWFETGSERNTQSAQNERVLERAVSNATLMNAIPARLRETAAHVMNSQIWQVDLRYGKDVAGPMTPEEQKLAQKLSAMLPA